jgi:microcystin-dependent protein
VSRSTYAALFGQLGTRFGEGDGINTFNVPNETGRFSIGAGPGYAQDATGGAASTVLTTPMLPSHNHAMPHTHTIYHVHTMAHTHTISHQHSMAHTHTINHDHPAIVSSESGNHRHTVTKEAGTVSQGSGSNKTVVVPGDGGEVNTSLAGAHTHNVNIAPYTGTSGSTATLTADSNTANSGSSSAANTGASSQDNSGGPSVPNTASTGAGQSFTNLPPYRAIRVLIKT